MLLTESLRNKLIEDLNKEQKRCSARTLSVEYIEGLLNDNKELFDNLIKDNIKIKSIEIRRGEKKRSYTYAGTQADIIFNTKNNDIKNINVWRSNSQSYFDRIVCEIPILEAPQRTALRNKYNINKFGNLYI